MNWIDFLLNIAGLLLWIRWLGVGSPPPTTALGVNLVTTIRPAQKRGRKRWGALLALIALLIIRPVFYWQMGTHLTWVPVFQPVLLAIPFQSNELLPVTLFSIVSFGWVMALFYLYVWFLALINRPIKENQPFSLMVERSARPFSDWTIWIQPFLPFLVAAPLWTTLTAVLMGSEILPEQANISTAFVQALLIGIAVYLPLKWLIAGVTLGYLVTSYVYLGHHPFWTYIQQSGKRMMVPFGWLPLKFGKLDLAPLVIAPIILVAATVAEIQLSHLYHTVTNPPKSPVVAHPPSTRVVAAATDGAR